MVFVKIVLTWLKITVVFENKVQKLTLHIVAGLMLEVVFLRIYFEISTFQCTYVYMYIYNIYI